MRSAGRLGFALAALMSILGWIIYLARSSAVGVVMDLLALALILFGLGTAVSAVILFTSSRFRWPAAGVALLSLIGLGASLGNSLTAVSREEVVFASGTLKLRGSFYSAQTESPAPGIVFVHGSGRVTRSEHRFFARFLAERGIHALAFDKRGAGESEGSIYESDYVDYARDLVAAVDFLSQMPGLDPGHIGVVGFSEAEWVVPIAASQSDLIAFIVIVGASGLRPVDQVEEEIRLRLETMGFAENDVGSAVSLHRLHSDYLRGTVDPDQVKNAIERSSGNAWFAAAEDLPGEVYPREDYAWWRGVMDFDSAPYWRQVVVPVLLLKGTGDDRSAAVPATDRLRAMISGPCHVRLFAGADHMLLHWPLGKGVPPPVFADGYPQIVADWILEISRGPADTGDRS